MNQSIHSGCIFMFIAIFMYLSRHWYQVCWINIIQVNLEIDILDSLWNITIYFSGSIEYFFMSSTFHLKYSCPVYSLLTVAILILNNKIEWTYSKVHHINHCTPLTSNHCTYCTCTHILRPHAHTYSMHSAHLCIQSLHIFHVQTVTAHLHIQILHL